MGESKNKFSNKNFMETIGKLKFEHQQTIFKLNKKNEKLAADLLFEQKLNTENQKLIRTLQHENKELLSQIEKSKKQRTDYAVEYILDDKTVNRKKYYLVHWKGYGSDDDSWEPEKNLNCPYLLDKYRESKQKEKKH